MSEGARVEDAPLLGIRDDVVRLIRRGWWSVLLAQVFCKIVALLILGPIAVAILSALLGENASIGNTALIGFALSPAGFATILIMATLLLAGVLLEQAFMVCLMRQATDDPAHRPCIADALALTMLRSPKLASLAGGLVLRALAIVAPLLLAITLTYWLLLSGADINYYLSARPPQFKAALAIVAVLVLAASIPLLWLYARAFIALPVCLFETVPRLAVLRDVPRLPKHQRRAVLTVSVVWLTLRLTGLWLLVIVLREVNQPLAGRLPDDDRAAIWWIAALLAGNAMVLAFVAALDRAGFAALMTVLHRRFRGVSALASLHPPAAVRSTARWLVLTGVTVCVGVAMINTIVLVQQSAHKRRVTVTAHRAGALRAPENSLAALRLAIAAGADAAEIDVQRTIDGQLVVVHDGDLRRIAGTPLVIGQSTLEQLRQADIGEAIGPQFRGERVATLEQFIEAARDQIRLSIELKYYGSGDPQLAPQVVQTLLRTDFTGQASIISLDYAGLQQVRHINPSLPLGFLVSASVGDLTRQDVDFLSVSRSTFTPDLRRRADARGLRIAVWTVNTPDDVTRMIAHGADEIVTDDPEMAVRMVQRYRQLSDVERILLRFRYWLSK